jgi:multidrug resistance efflux pump
MAWPGPGRRGRQSTGWPERSSTAIRIWTDGSIIAAGTRLLSIDPTDYELAIAEAEAQIAAFKAERDQLDADQDQSREPACIERTGWRSPSGTWSAYGHCRSRERPPAARLDEQESQTLNARKAVQELDNQLALLPSRRNRLEAEVPRPTPASSAPGAI